MSTQAVTQATQRLRLHVGLAGLPRTALPTDLQRFCGKAKVENVAHVAINYKRFRPNGTATLAFSRPEYVPAAIKALDKTVLGGKTIKASILDSVRDASRMRGQKGLLEAGQRGVIRGDGPDAGITGGGKNVVLYGLPGRLVAGVLAEQLRQFKIAGLDQGKPVLIKLESGKGSAAGATSRWLCRMESVSEAYRLVRTIHMQQWRPDLHGDKFVVRAAVIS
ncbi:hypothetical protein L226DRAFT_530319 [Lentinus tigrinus ALCF2SS1-7]|uniref:RRM domain-containing protein n=1 Tax=Lentinus tigrinus ALCF2SS1-6 TaxID=1328759 RepID=A0A5C2SQR3_9APHY|nr:hypothetical protein L227DRAFT_570106 [Lentinus tigrinus ALCF2SS1-6]RPD80133.1 hypothetical protein L226DRAFT_530319 [Lentinus tigrinus ALCF2SS1-7]